MNSIIITLIFAVIGGFLPAIIWLTFWLREDSLHPEPNPLLIRTFIYGMLAVPVAFLAQTLFNFLFLGDTTIENLGQKTGLYSLVIVLIWAFIEELVKFLAARNGALKRKENDEPIDVPIYMITAALGFAALENALFLISPLIDANYHEFFITSNLRFIGATLVHVASSATIGIFAALSYFFMNKMKKRYLLTGFVLATLLHAVFNLFIIRTSEMAFIGFTAVWTFIVLVIILFEKIKKIKLNKI